MTGDLVIRVRCLHVRGAEAEAAKACAGMSVRAVEPAS